MSDPRQALNGQPPPPSARQRLREEREAEERRRFGLAPLLTDSEIHDKKVEINPNVPTSLSHAPWFYEAQGPTLVHQRARDPKIDAQALSDVTDRVVVTGKAQRFMPGACKNCGSRTHKTAACFLPRKKTGAEFSGKITGVDLQLQRGGSDGQGVAKKTYSQKRDWYSGDVGVDLMRQATTDEEPDGNHHEDGGSGALAPPHKQVKKEGSALDIFSRATAQHGGVEVKECPKYLANLDAMEAGLTFFDPKTGSMRGDPNVVAALTGSAGEGEDITPMYHGDQYRSGDYHLYVEQQVRFLTGQSKCMVDFELDAAVGRLQSQQQNNHTSSSSSANHLKAKEVSTDALHSASLALGIAVGDGGPLPNNAGSAGTTTPAEVSQMVHHLYGSDASSAEKRQQEQQQATAHTNPSAAPAVVTTSPTDWMASRREQLEMLAVSHASSAHSFPYGSYFDMERWTWGYLCCHKVDPTDTVCGKQ